MAKAPEQIYAFLDELHALSKKHDIYIDGCGDCGSPWLSDGDAVAYNLTPDAESGYTVSSGEFGPTLQRSEATH